MIVCLADSGRRCCVFVFCLGENKFSLYWELAEESFIPSPSQNAVLLKCKHTPCAIQCFDSLIKNNMTHCNEIFFSLFNNIVNLFL